MSEKYNTNINSIEEAIKQLEDLKKDRLSFVTGDAEHDNIFLRDVQAIEIVLGNLEALADMQGTADRELENARRINEEHKKENEELKATINKQSIDISKNLLELQQKDKQIDLMAEVMFKSNKAQLLIEYGIENKEQIIKEFEKLVKEKGE